MSISFVVSKADLSLLRLFSFFFIRKERPFLTHRSINQLSQPNPNCSTKNEMINVWRHWQVLCSINEMSTPSCDQVLGNQSGSVQIQEHNNNRWFKCNQIKTTQLRNHIKLSLLLGISLAPHLQPAELHYQPSLSTLSNMDRQILRQLFH